MFNGLDCVLILPLHESFSDYQYPE